MCVWDPQHLSQTWCLSACEACKQACTSRRVGGELVKSEKRYLLSGHRIIFPVVGHDFNIIISKSVSGATAFHSSSHNPLALSIFPQPVSFPLFRYFTFNSHYPLANVHIATGWHSFTKQKSHLIFPFSCGLRHKVLFKKNEIRWYYFWNNEKFNRMCCWGWGQPVETSTQITERRS